jgi:hypothetical protein
MAFVLQIFARNHIFPNIFADQEKDWSAQSIYIIILNALNVFEQNRHIF